MGSTRLKIKHYSLWGVASPEDLTCDNVVITPYNGMEKFISCVPGYGISVWGTNIRAFEQLIHRFTPMWRGKDSIANETH